MFASLQFKLEKGFLMIIFIRRWLKGGGFQIILWVALGFMAIVFMMPEGLRQSSKRASELIMTVNGEELRGDLLRRKTHAFEEHIQQVKRQWGQYAETLFQMMGKKLDPKSMAYEQMINDALLGQAAQKVDIHLHPDYIQEKLSDPYFIQTVSDLIPMSAFDQFGINQRALDYHLAQIGLTSQDLQQELRSALQRQLLNEMVLAANYVPSFEMKQQEINDYAPKKFSILTLSLDKILKEEQQKDITPEELQEFFNRKKATTKQYTVPEKREGMMWKFNSSGYGIEIPDSDIEEYYNTYKMRLYADKPAQVQVRRILFNVTDEAELPFVMQKAEEVRKQLIDNPDQFKEKAQELSQDTQTVKDGGLMPFFSRGTYDKEFEKAAFLLTEDGAISQVVRTDNGVEILQRAERKQQTFKPLSEVKDEIKKKLELREFKGQFIQDMQEMLEDGDLSEQDLEELVKKYGSKSEKIESIGKDESKLAQRLFRLETDKYGFFVDDSTGVIVKLTAKNKAHVPELKAIEKQVQQDLYKERASKKLENLLKKAKKSAQTQAISQVSQELGATVKTTDWIEPGNREELEKLRQKGLPIEGMLQLEKAGCLVTDQDVDYGYLVRLDEIKSLDEGIIKEKQAEVYGTALKEQLGLLTSGFVASLYRNAIIKNDESLPFTTEDDSI